VPAKKPLSSWFVPALEKAELKFKIEGRIASTQVPWVSQ
jgi:hypothetical protein